MLRDAINNIQTSLSLAAEEEPEDIRFVFLHGFLQIFLLVANRNLVCAEIDLSESGINQRILRLQTVQDEPAR
jgi:hypothetical protein